jgi:uncharacterized membrane protein YfcA
MYVLETLRDAWSATGWANVAITFATLVLTYAIFSMVGFGSAVIAAPILALRMHLTTIVPLLSLLDLAAALANTGKLGRKIDKKEIAFLTPLMAGGSAVGIFLLISTAPNRLMFGFGVLVIAYSLYRLFAGTSARHFGGLWVVPFGLIGGLLSGMFGSGGFIFSVYLSHRLKDKDVIRATMTAMTGLSSLFRVCVFLAIGTYTDLGLLALAAFGLPALAVGIYCGHHITLRMSYEQFLRTLCLMLIATGSSLIWRALHT